MKTKIPIFLMVIGILCILLQQSDTHASDISYTGTCGENLTWSLDFAADDEWCEEGILYIYGSGEMESYYNNNSSPWYIHHSQIQTIILEEGVTSIGNYAFADCAVDSITMPHSVTSIGEGAFYDCTHLNDVVIPDGVMSIAKYAFYNCRYLNDITIPGGVTNIGDYAFNSCIYLKNITFPDSVTSIGEGAFGGCSSLTQITIPSRVTSIDRGVFGDCNSLSKIIIPSSVTSIGMYAFTNCYALESITIPDSVTNIEYEAFSGCTSLKSITIPDNVARVVNGAFRGCSSLTKIVIPDSVTGIAALAFEDTAYYNDEANWKDEMLYIGNHLIHVKETKDGECEIRNGTVAIANGAFESCAEVTSVIIPDSVITIGDGAFSHCYNLKQVIMPESVMSIGNTAFCFCESLTEIFIPDSVTVIGEGAFWYCTGLKSITIPDGVMTIGDGTFYECIELTSVGIPNSVTSIGEYAFYYCINLTSVKLPCSVTSIGNETFRYCSNLTGITILNSECNIYDKPYTLGDANTTVIYGYTDSTAQAYARKYGYTFTVIDENVEIHHSLNLASDISINYFVSRDLLSKYDSFFLECIVPQYEGNIRVGSKTVTVMPVLNDGYYCFTMSDITAVNMNDVLVATLRMTKGTQEYVSKTDNYSVATYALNQLNKEDADQKLKILCADLLRYGAAAQNFKGYRTDAKATSAMTAEHKVWLSNLNAVTFGNTNTIYNDLASPLIKWAGKTLNLGSKVVVKFIFNAGAYTGSISNLTLRVIYQDNSGAQRTITLSNPEVYNEGKRQYAFAFDGLMAAELRTAISVAVYAGDVQLSQTLQYSADTYGNNKTGALGELCKALFAYSDSAKKYFS